MAGADRMTIEQVVKKVLVEDHADVVRESVRWVAEQMMEAEVSELVGAELGERKPEDRATHRNGVSPAAVGYAGGGDRVTDPQAAPGQLLPQLLDASQALRAGIGRGGPAGVCLRRVDPPGRSAGRESGAADL